jgi:hypothetical protein
VARQARNRHVAVADGLDLFQRIPPAMYMRELKSENSSLEL